MTFNYMVIHYITSEKLETYLTKCTKYKRSAITVYPAKCSDLTFIDFYVWELKFQDKNHFTTVSSYF